MYDGVHANADITSRKGYSLFALHIPIHTRERRHYPLFFFQIILSRAQEKIRPAVFPVAFKEEAEQSTESSDDPFIRWCRTATMFPR